MHSVIAFVFLLMFQISWANDCNFFKRVEAEGLYQNEAFWTDYAKLSDHGNASESQIDELFEKYGGKETDVSISSSEPVTPPSVNRIGHQTVELHRHAEKSFHRAPPQIQRKIDALVTLANEKGTDELIRSLKTHGWNYEFIQQKGRYSVRLNDGYRALFEVKEGKMIIYEIGQHVYRH